MAHSATLPIETQTGPEARLTLGITAITLSAYLALNLTTELSKSEELSKLLLLIRP